MSTRWYSKRIVAYLVIAGVFVFAASVPFVFLGGTFAVMLLAISVICLGPRADLLRENKPDTAAR